MNDLFPITHAYLIPLLPLAAAALVLLLGAKVLKGASHWPIWLGVGAAAALSLWTLVAMVGSPEENLTSNPVWFTWIEAGAFKVNAAFLIDPLTAVMLSVVTGIGFLIMIFSAGYMKGEKGYWRFFAALGLFIFAMTILVLADNLILLYLGWEGVGLASYLLIGFYSDKPEARDAAKKAFIVNRIGDCGLAIGIMLIFALFGTTNFWGDHGFLTQITQHVAFDGWKLTAFHAIPFLLLLGCFGKSAQFPLYTWLPDAMAGPTPVSALIHAATMVTAGVYLVVRCSVLFYGSAGAMTLLAIVACFTSILAASIAMRQYDLKKVFAYSTVSQLGFMFVGAAMFAPVAAIFHLMTHAFFKALLFLSSGVVMHAMAGELDLRKMSGLKRRLPITRVVMLIGCAALAGFPFLSGFFSKDEILGAAFARSPIIGALMLACAGLTAYYTFRLYFRVFEGETFTPADGKVQEGMGAEEGSEAVGQLGSEGEDAHSHDAHGHDAHAHDAHHGPAEPAMMILPLLILAIGAVAAGYVNFPGEHLTAFLEKSQSVKGGLDLARATPVSGIELKPVVMLGVSSVVALLGIAAAFYFHLVNRAAIGGISKTFAPLVKLLEGKWFVDEIYGATVVRGLWFLGKASDIFDLIINVIVWGVSYVPKVGALGLRYATQRGYLQGYAVAMLVGLAIVLVIFFRS
jgi:NADH-quinone oxidoreductase subunit L